MSTIDVTGLGFDYGGAPVLDGLDLTLDSGLLLAVIGPSGCGKTTLLRLLAGFERPRGGSIRIGDVEVAAPGLFVAPDRRRIGLVPQEGALFPHLTLGENIGFALSRRDPGRRDRIRELTELIGLAGLEGRYPRELSGGQQQRVALARALAPRPQLVLLDEPFASLDPVTRVGLRRAVREILTAERATAVMVTHDREEALSMSDRVAALLAGRIVQFGEPHRVYDAPADLRVASLLGEATVLAVDGRDAGTVRCALGALPVGSGEGDRVLVRPEQVRLDAAGVPAVVVESQFVGSSTRVLLELTSGERVVATLTDDRPGVGERIGLTVTRPVHLLGT